MIRPCAFECFEVHYRPDRVAYTWTVTGGARVLTVGWLGDQRRRNNLVNNPTVVH